MTDHPVSRHPPSLAARATYARSDVTELEVEPRTVSSTVLRPDAAAQEVAKLYDEHYEFLCRAFFRLGINGSQIDDAIQDSFIVVFRRYSEFERRSSVRSWLYGIAIRVALAYKRRSGRRRHEPLEDDDARLIL
ncbi:MAG: sigma factor [Polyangiaceae bacterium]